MTAKTVVGTLFFKAIFSEYMYKRRSPKKGPCH